MPIVVEHYNPAWPQHFEKIKSTLHTYLRDVTIVSIEHVGSTSVPGLAAKPIIDIDIIVTRDNVQPAIDALVQNGGFTYIGELGIVDRHALRDPDQSPARNTYVCVEGAFQVRNHLGLRDTLRSNPELRDEYSNVKLNLAAQGVEDIGTYIRGKNAVIQKILKASGLLTDDELRTVNSVNTDGGQIAGTKTERLLLREFVYGDLDGFYELESNPEVVRYQGFPPRTREEAKELILEIIRNASVAPRSHVELAVIYNQTFIGRVGARISHAQTEGRDTSRTANLWYSFKPEWHGQGFATEAIRKFVELLGSPLRLEIECDPRNKRSVKMAERLGFQKVREIEKAYENKGEWVGSVVFEKEI
ncbi:acyl-CoA N-acyltransferase [Westerdykella ornata]|uniref:Acyl-CoA N-acyltransferase n=1 Tax=Westerdykella ornata TaxID=318751 RepID=A0A6A6JQJ4_WESOR|nr:acyl-CoA N-acyltransferase [Westerdykella ornata]KAF2278901.1 acyl-CoA N-acyltransferase [Westerdykella ornata]